MTQIPSQGGDIGSKTEFELTDSAGNLKSLKLVYGDYNEELASIAEYHKKAADLAENENQKQMHLAYAKSFEEGSMKAHKDSQRFWIKDKGPMVESNIGFIETYRDPHGVRGEWEGMVMVSQIRRNKLTLKCKALLQWLT